MYRNQFNNTDLSGQTGNIIRWESSTDNFTTDTDIANTTTTLTATNLTTTQYRASKWCLYRSNFCYSNHYCRSDFGGGSIAEVPMCTGTNSTTLTLSGQTGNIIRWESSTDNFTTDTDIANTTTTLTATNLTTTTQYRAIVQSGACTEATSATATITVDPTSVEEVLREVPMCTGTNSTTLTLSGQTGNIIRWESSTDNFTTDTDIANTTTLTATNLTTAIPCNRTKWCLYRSYFCYSNHYCRSDFGGRKYCGKYQCVYRNQFNNTDPKWTDRKYHPLGKFYR
ncbi:hypothetical protein HBA12_00905 [Tenacibaculum mesophilum]|uniref:hypothetical protein n=1 Tax=Tenacibaculum mesophilum TaxID=104268 RepID=UPI0014316761|nr:hypothetical protein [Tenacibaculum mesophilum]KAF9658837.1 hypothetical protein HBA12_00905 [Tenacibaculum mesophilum]